MYINDTQDPTLQKFLGHVFRVEHNSIVVAAVAAIHRAIELRVMLLFAPKVRQCSVWRARVCY
jgi:hypothetical protein